MNDEQTLLAGDGSQDEVQENIPTGATLESFGDLPEDATFVMPHPPQND